MRTHPVFVVLALLPAWAPGQPTPAARSAPRGPTRLRCEYRRDPLGIDAPHPRLSWEMRSANRGARQTAYRVQAASSRARLASGRPDLWDSGRVSTGQSTFVPYRGRPLRSLQTCWWRVRLWDEAGRASPWSAPASWTVGMLRAADWQARWIGAVARVEQAGGGLGYHATEAASADEVKWVQVDLGAHRAFDAVRLHALNHLDPARGARVPGFGFPLRFRIQTSDDPSFRSVSATLFARVEADYPNPGHAAVTFPCWLAAGRYVRVTATKLWDRGSGTRPYCFGLAELEVLRGDRNLALRAPVTAADSVEQWGWGHVQLTDGLGRVERGPATDPGYAALYLRKEFMLDRKPVRAAAAFCGLGYGELHLNGRKVGMGLMEPAWTDYTKRVLYTVHDVTPMVRQGRNVVGAIVGNGWYRLATPDLFGYEHATWTAPPALLVHLRVWFADGTSQSVVTDGSWRWSTGPLTFNCVRGGETWDARADHPAWCQPGESRARWKPVVVLPGPRGRLAAEQVTAERVTRRLRPVKLLQPRPGVWVYDLGEHISGYARFSAAGPAGSKVELRFDENLNADGTITQRSLNSHTNGRYQTGELVLSGRPRDVFEPRFTYHGFRYVQVTGLGRAPAVSDLTGLEVHNDFDSAGEFACGNGMLNRVQHAVRRAILNCMHGVQTEPAREKVNWTEDAHNTVPPALWNFEFATFARKWLDDVADSQEPNGHVPPINPNAGWGHTRPGGAAPDWSDPWWGGVIVEMPWMLYAHCGDREALERAYGPMRRWVDYLGTTARDGAYLDWWLGDWLEVGVPGRPVRTPIELTSTAAYAYYARQVARAAALIGRPDDAARYGAIADRVRDAFNKRFLDRTTGLYNADSQTAQAMALELDLAPPEMRAAVLDRLVENVARRQGHLSAGFVGYLYLLQALTHGGRGDVAYTIATREDYPGWGPMVRDGGTTLWEAWNGNAYNFSSLGGVGAWFYESVAGLAPDPAAPGFERAVIRPGLYGDLAWARASHETLRGRFAVAWERHEGRLSVTVTVPANCTARVFLPPCGTTTLMESGRPAVRAAGIRSMAPAPEGTVVEVGSGTYTFVAPVGGASTTPAAYRSGHAVSDSRQPGIEGQ